jgi:hypothetical protein
MTAPEKRTPVFKAEGMVVIRDAFIISHNSWEGGVSLTVGDLTLIDLPPHKWGNHEQALIPCDQPSAVLDQAEIVFETKGAEGVSFTILVLYSPTSAKSRLVRVPLESTRPKPDPERAKRLLGR